VKRLFGPTTLLFFGLWLVLLAGGRSKFFQDPGTFWHTVVGEQILTTRGFFDTDEFTFTFAGRPWIPHQWLGEVVMALAHRIADFDALLLLAATLLAALYAWLGARLMRAGFHWSIAAVLVAFAVAASSGHFHVRPHLATIVCFAITMAFLTDYGAGRIGAGRLALLIPLFLIWTNTHGGMLGGLVTFGLAIAGWAVAWRLGWESPLWSWKDLGRLALIFLGCAATALVNPYGIRLPETWLTIYDSAILPQIIKEHSAIDLSEWSSILIVLFGVFYMMMLAGIWPEKPRISWLLPLAWLALACLRVRHAPLFAVGGLIALADFFPQTRWAARLVAAKSDLFVQPEKQPSVRWSARLAAVALPALAVLAAVGLQVGRVPAPVVGAGWAAFDPKVWPVELLDELRAHEHDRPEGATRIFNEYTYGGFLIYCTPGYRVFVDDRCELFGDAWLQDFVDAEHMDTAGHIRLWQDRYGRFDLALVATDSGFDNFFRNSIYWSEVKRTQTATLYKHE
jgi:hypothetical protein